MKIFDNKFIYKYRYGVIIFFVMLVFLFWDQLFKMFTDGYTINILGDFLYFNSVHNYGAAYGIFAGKTLGLIITTSIVLALLIVFNWFYKGKSIFYCWAMGLILSGAVGNLIDRVFLGYVRDFIKLKIFSFTCNIADICLCVGIALFAVHIIFLDKTPRQKKKVKVPKNQPKVAINKRDEDGDD